MFGQICRSNIIFDGQSMLPHNYNRNSRNVSLAYPYQKEEHFKSHFKSAKTIVGVFTHIQRKWASINCNLK